MALHKRTDNPITTHNKFNLLFVALSVIAFEAIVLTLAIVPPATEYEVALHDVYPAWFWLVMGFIILAPLIYLLVTHIVKAKWFSLKTAYWLLGVACTTSVLTKIIPLARGYYAFGAGDSHTHYGIIKDILEYGVNSFNNHYPFVHVDISTLILFSGLPPELSALLLHTSYYAFWLVAFYLIGRFIMGNQKQTIILISLMAIPLYIQDVITINTFGYFVVFFYIYLCLKAIFVNDKSAKKYLVLSIIFSIALWYLHPETVLIATISVLIVGCTYVLYSWISSTKINMNTQYLVVIMCCLLIGCGYIFSMTTAFSSQITQIEMVLNGLELAEQSTYSQLSTIEYSFSELFIIAILLYGQYLFISGFAAVTLLYLIFIQRKNLNVINIILISLFVCISILSLLMMLLGLPTGKHPQRLLKTILVFAVFVLVYNLPIIFKRRITTNKLMAILLILSIFSTAYIGVGGLYGNTYLNSYNAPVMKQDYVSAQTFLNTQSGFYLIESATGRNIQYRYSHYINGYHVPLAENIRTYAQSSRDSIDEHLGYGNYIYMGEQFDDNRYYLLYPPYGDIVRVGNIPLLLGGVNQKDVERLNYDISADKISNAGENEVYIVYGLNSQRIQS